MGIAGKSVGDFRRKLSPAFLPLLLSLKYVTYSVQGNTRNLPSSLMKPTQLTSTLLLKCGLRVSNKHHELFEIHSLQRDTGFGAANLVSCKCLILGLLLRRTYTEAQKRLKLNEEKFFISFYDYSMS